MKYLFVFLLIGLVSCGDASGEATKVSKANVNSHINENTDWTKILKCDDIDGVVATYSQLSKKRGREDRQRELSKFSGYVKYCGEDGGLDYLVGYRDGILVSDRKYGTKNDQRYLELERLKLDDGIQRTRFYRVSKGNPYLHEERFLKNGKRYGTNREWATNGNHPLVIETTFDKNGTPIKQSRWRGNGELSVLAEFSSP
jgi:antitoxin component YwqK of YwqJK toxin-antitoxin module